MSRRKWTILIVALALVPPMALIAGIATAPRTPEAWFTSATGLEYPADAKVVENTNGYRRMLIETFVPKGARLFVFSADEDTIRRWTSAPPPWQKAWSRGLPSGWINARFSLCDNYHSTMRGNDAHGELLAIDPVTRTVWLYKWDN